ncbi:phytochelatin synthase family protein [Sinimarinibacterium sp. CAU 1509]|uniref:phytochelatin synthase family protein n=1 Tax=Sinimarinibacterium sp. CAU 1509 TaxID=2562283 RepID=UPI00146E15F5|nr:phytochelatin synthase family protein [Sinimarinibacterium sp. CAU 1509]
MSFRARWVCMPLLAAAFLAPAMARDEAPAIQSNALIAFASDEGFARLTRASGHADFSALANQFEAQSNRGFCGPTTATIVLNAVHAGSTDAPRDSSRLRPEDLKYAPKGFDLTVPRFTQENVFDKAGKTRAQVFGEPVTINGKPTSDYGFQLRQIDELLRANGLPTKLVVVDDDKPEADIRADLVANLQHAGDFVIVNYQRKAIGQPGGAHISPLGAYDAESDSVLVLDVNPSAAGWVWVPMPVMIKGMRTFDTIENRGYIQVQGH